MKKVITMLFVLSGVAAAETVDLLTNSGDWTCSNTSITSNVLQGTGHWGKGYASYSLNTPITLNFDMTLELSYTITFTNMADVAATVALHSNSDVLAFGAKTYNGSGKDAPLCIGYSTENAAINADAITFGQGYGYIFSSYTETEKTAGITKNYDGTSVSHSIMERITWSDNEQKYVATIFVDGDKAGEQILGSSYTLEKITVTSEGNQDGGWRSQPAFSNMQLNVIPEPTTATLSLLALAGLASRRRRR